MITNELKSGDRLIEELEGYRREHRKDFPFRNEVGKAKEKIIESKRSKHAGGSDNHQFEGERYLNCTVKSIRRQQLRKLVDEGGLSTFGGKVPSHPMLDRLGSYEFGLTDEEITRLEKGDPSPEKLIVRGWWVHLNRTQHWSIAIGSGMVVEGEKKVDPEKEANEIKTMRKEYAEMGIKNLDNALWFASEHAEVDIDHTEFNEKVIKQFVNTPELQYELRKAFILRLQNQGF